MIVLELSAQICMYVTDGMKAMHLSFCERNEFYLFSVRVIIYTYIHTLPSEPVVQAQASKDSLCPSVFLQPTYSLSLSISHQRERERESQVCVHGMREGWRGLLVYSHSPARG